MELGGLGLLRLDLVVQVEVVNAASDDTDEAERNARDGKGLACALLRVERGRLGGCGPGPSLGQGLA